MAFELASFQDPSLDADYVNHLVDNHAGDAAGRFGLLWDYYRNPLMPASGIAAGALNANSRPYFQAQEIGLPARITGVERHPLGAERLTDLRRKEVVIENDIAWRIGTMVDFLFGRNITIRSLAGEPRLAETIENVLSTLLEVNGGMGFLQEVALLGAVYGFVDIALRTPADGFAKLPPTARSFVDHSADELDPDEQGTSAGRPGMPYNDGNSASSEDGRIDSKGDWSRIPIDRVLHATRQLQLETIEAPRILPILEEDDFRRVRYWIQRFFKHPARMGEGKRPWFNLGLSRRRSPGPAVVEVVEILSSDWWQRYEDRRLVAEGPNMLNRLPIVHIQNIASPGAYEGFSNVEPLIPLQDELNTRLSDRAHRVTYQSFKMYLGKGIDDFLERPVGPGQMWSTQNLQASIEEFGSDSGSPSEDAHIEQVRQALDKTSGVTPLAAGLIRGNIGHLTSATALKVLLGGLLANTVRKRLTYGEGISQMFDLALDWLDRMGILRTAPGDRKIEIHWLSPLPADDAEQLRNAQIKAQLGVPTERILTELGYDTQTLNTDQN